MNVWEGGVLVWQYVLLYNIKIFKSVEKNIYKRRHVPITQLEQLPTHGQSYFNHTPHTFPFPYYFEANNKYINFLINISVAISKILELFSLSITTDSYHT